LRSDRVLPSDELLRFTSGTIRPVLLIVGPPCSAIIVSGDTIFEQRLVAAPTASVRPAQVGPTVVVPQPDGHAVGN
jgi:hypothetical protein